MPTVAKEVTLPSGQVVIEAHCPWDSTIVFRIAKKEIVKDEQSGLDTNVSRTESKDSFDDFEE